MIVPVINTRRHFNDQPTFIYERVFSLRSACVDQIYKYKTSIGGKHTTFHIYDSCGDLMVVGGSGMPTEDDAEPYESRARFEQLLKWADVVLLLFSLVEPESFVKADKCRKWIHHHRRRHHHHQNQQQQAEADDAQAVLVVGTKADLIDGRRMQTERLIAFAGNRKQTVHRSSARESYDSALAVFQQAHKEVTAAGHSCRSPTRKLRTLLQSTLRSYLVRANAAAHAHVPDAPEKPTGATASTVSAAAEDEASPESAEKDDGDEGSKPCGGGAVATDYRSRTFTL